GRLMVRQYEESQASRMGVLFDAGLHEYSSEDEFELGVSVAASLSVQAVRSGREHYIASSGGSRGSGLRELPSQHPSAVLDAWAELRPVDAAPRLESAAHAVAAAQRPLSVVVLVTGSSPELGRIRKASASFAEDVQVIAIRCESLGAPRVQRMDSLTLCTVGELA